MWKYYQHPYSTDTEYKKKKIFSLKVFLVFPPFLKGPLKNETGDSIPECFPNLPKINSLEVNQTEAKVISKERNYANKPEELVRSFSLCMLSLDLGQGFSKGRLIMYNEKRWRNGFHKQCSQATLGNSLIGPQKSLWFKITK